MRTIRLPELDSVPLTRPILEIIDHPHFQRLRRVRQLGPTSIVYPGAVHTRFEHAIGVYGTTRRYLQSLLQLPHVADSLGAKDLRCVLLAGLLHDVGHYPFAHTLEAAHQGAVETPRHEDLAEALIMGRSPAPEASGCSIATLMKRAFGVDPERVIGLISARRSALENPIDRLLQSVISSAIDADKMDYLWRDSVHLGVPYGRNYDRERLLNALTVNGDGDAIAVSSKGLISAEIFLFCRYTMYSEVYWHHTVRSASVMLERAWEDLVAADARTSDDLSELLLGVGDDAWLDTMVSEATPGSAAARYLAGLTGGRRRLYKRFLTWSRVSNDATSRAVYERLYGLDRLALRQLEERLRHRLAKLGRPMDRYAIMIDVPPRDKDQTPDVQIHYDRAIGGHASYTSLADASMIVRGISEDFLNVVKKIRLLIHPDYVPELAAHRHAAYEAIVDEILTGHT